MKKSVKKIIISISIVLIVVLIAIITLWFTPQLRCYFLRYFFEGEERSIGKVILDDSDLDIVKDINYLGDGNIYHNLDIYKRKNENNDKLLFCIHGGGLFANHKETNLKYCYELTRKGFTVVSINYSLLPSVSLFTQIKECMQALKYIDDNKTELKINTDNAVITGDSAGALLALFVSSINADTKLQKEFNINGASFQFKDVMLVSIMLDTQRSDVLSCISKLVTTKEDTNKDYYQYLVNPRKLIDNTKLENVFLVTSEEDFIQKETLSLYELLNNKINVELKNYPKNNKNVLDHVFGVKNPQIIEAQDYINSFIEFIKK